MLEFEDKGTDWLSVVAVVLMVLASIYFAVKLVTEWPAKKHTPVYIGGALLIGEVESND